jgi:hypothetical protein
MNLQLKKLAEQAGFQYITEEGIGWAGNYNASLPKFAELILSKVLDAVVNTDVTSVVYTSHDKDRAAAVLTLVERGLLKEFNITEKV